MGTVLIHGGTMYDGSGCPGRRADILIRDDRIAGVAERIDTAADSRVNAEGLAVAPGFIDIHSHTDTTIFPRPLAESKITQGITTDVTGSCGISAFPVDRRFYDELLAYLNIHEFRLPEPLGWIDFREYTGWLEQLPLGLNLAPQVGHGALRIAVMGSDDRQPTKNELGRMQELLAEELEQGLWGLSAGLIYPPGSFAQTEELIALAKVLQKYGAIYTCHIRGEGDTLLDSIQEMVRIGRASGARVHISHLKAIGKPNWGKGTEALAQIRAARESGLDISADQYPYEASSTSLTVLVPAWAHAGGGNALLKRLADNSLQARLKEDIARAISARGGPERIMAVGIKSGQNSSLSGKNLDEIAREWSSSAAEAVIRLLLEEKGAVMAVLFVIADADVRQIMASRYVAVGTDGRAFNTADSQESTHPRSYGTFPRILGKYVRDEKVLDLATAIYKMTGLPAERLQLSGRGLLREGYFADVTIFDPEKVSDVADFTDSHRYARGIEYVMINGTPVVKNGRITGEAPGRVLYKTRP